MSPEARGRHFRFDTLIPGLVADSAADVSLQALARISATEYDNAKDYTILWALDSALIKPVDTRQRLQAQNYNSEEIRSAIESALTLQASGLVQTMSTGRLRPSSIVLGALNNAPRFNEYRNRRSEQGTRPNPTNAMRVQSALLASIVILAAHPEIGAE